ncbi:MAG: AraC family transcriptional regulator [Bacteroidales bacterium]|jgi:AraC-like DNA-binding protein
MTNELNSLIVVIIYGSLTMLSFLTLANPLKVNKKANFWFGIFTFLWATFWIEEIVQLVFTNTIGDSLAMCVSFVQYFTPIIFYFSVLFFTNPNYKFKIYDLKYLFLPIIYLAVLIAQKYYYKENSITLILSGLILIQTLLYTTLSYIKIRRHKKKIVLFASNIKGIDLNWLEYIIFIVLIISIVVGIYNIFFKLSALNLFMNSFFLITVFFVSYYSMKQKEIFPLNKEHRNEIIAINEEEHAIEMKRKIIPDEELGILKSQLDQLMQNQKPYLDSELNLIKLSQILNITPHQLSYLLNYGFNENFFHFINKYRVEMAKAMLKTKKLNKYSILGIAYESGFNSKTSFNTTFKKMTNQTPSEFKKKSSDS